MLETTEQRATISSKAANNHPYFGTVVSGSSQKGWNVRFDVLPYNENIITEIKRNKLIIVRDKEEEAEIELKHDELEEQYYEHTPEISPCDLNKKKTNSRIAIETFQRLTIDEKKNITKFVMPLDQKEETVEWQILKDGEHHSDSFLSKVNHTLTYKKDIDFLKTPLIDTFFQDIFPDVTGHALLLDEYYSDVRAPYFETVKNDNIKFLDTSNKDPDWIVKQCYTLLIAAKTEVECGVDNLWRKGYSSGRHSYPNFGKYMSINKFRAFCSAAIFCCCDKSYWYKDKRDLTWDVFNPILRQMNEKRNNLFQSVLLVLDESMIGWKPKTSATGNLPNITHEPRKPKDLGTMFRNCCECLSGSTVNHDSVAMPEKQNQKSIMVSNLISKKPMQMKKKQFPHMYLRYLDR